MFYNPDKFEFTRRFSACFDQIKAEMLATLKLPLGALNENTWAGERPNYLTSSHDPNLAWKTYVFKYFGISHLPNQKACPTITQLLQEFPFIVTAEFSMLEPETHILPHTGFTNRVLRSHFAMVVPEGDTGIKVGEEVKSWKEGEWLVFDDSVVHEAWNKTPERRIVLMIDFDPNLSAEDGRASCAEILNATNDKHMMDIAPRELWLDGFNTGHFPIEI